MTLKFCAPGFHDLPYLDKLAQLNQVHGARARVHEVYGAAPETGGLHSRHRASSPSDNNEFFQYIEHAHGLGIEVNVVINAPVRADMQPHLLGPRLSQLESMGVDSLTISDPRILMLAGRHAMRTDRVLSTIADVTSVRDLRHWQRFGFERVVPRCDVNRKIGVLQDLVKYSSAAVEILVNLDCVPSCGLSDFHYAETAAREGTSTGSLCRDFCSAERLADTAEFLRSPWVLPEDCEHYAGLGVEYFKVVGREFPQPDVLAILAAYLTGQFDGNLIDLLRPVAKQAFVVGDKSLEVTIDTRDLRATDFMRFFLLDKCRFECHRCTYCEKHAGLVKTRGSGKVLVLEQELRRRLTGGTQ